MDSSERDTSANAEMIEYWNDHAGPSWVRFQKKMDGQISGIGKTTMDRAGINAGQRVLDIGCGCGDSTLELARRVGPTGAGGNVGNVRRRKRGARRASATKRPGCAAHPIAKASNADPTAAEASVRRPVRASVTPSPDCVERMGLARHSVTTKPVARMAVAGRARTHATESVTQRRASATTPGPASPTA
ncbi:MAG: hypothetical protein CFH39_02545 [Alphaproteobacteria bacterium MarineAlpha10_Bin2]|nr:MAG: hypothetical protein CFH39_02545 [Alphaproteobacteria bacterium MarineAlpha10_Bin2]